MAITRTFEIRSKQEASNIITAIHNNFFCNDNGNITVVAWDDSNHYKERNYPPAMIFRRNK